MSLRIMGLGFCAFSFGLLTAGGVFTVLLAVGLIPRFAGKTHTGRYVLLYENMVILGTIVGNVVTVFGIKRIPIGSLAGDILLAVYGFFAGIFVGSLAMAIAEMLDSIPIFARRVGLRHGIGIVVSMMALGKMAGALYYFQQRLYLPH